MAGSWNHTVEKPSGKLLAPEDLTGMLECRSGDVYEYAEEAYGMVWYLATLLAHVPGSQRTPAECVERARTHYQEGLAMSPGTGAVLPVEE